MVRVSRTHPSLRGDRRQRTVKEDPNVAALPGTGTLQGGGHTPLLAGLKKSLGVILPSLLVPPIRFKAALGELPRAGKPRQLPDDAIAWVLNCACQKPKELGYSDELWTYKLLTAHVRRHCVGSGHPALQKLSRSKLHKILRQGELRPHKIRYYVERQDAVRRWP